MKSGTEALYYRSVSSSFGLLQQAMARVRKQVMARVEDVREMKSGQSTEKTRASHQGRGTDRDQSSGVDTMRRREKRHELKRIEFL